MSASSAPYVVVGIDFSPASEIVFERAFDAADRHSGAQVHVMTVATGSFSRTPGAHSSGLLVSRFPQ